MYLKARPATWHLVYINTPGITLNVACIEGISHTFCHPNNGDLVEQNVVSGAFKL